MPATLPTASSRGALVGRARERECLEEALNALPTSGTALLLRGDSGVGKTTLLDYVARKASERFRVHRVSGVETEATLPFAALGELVIPLSDHLRALPEAQRESLEGALALGSRPASVNPYAVCVGALNLLSSAGQQTHRVVLVDDLHWVDPDSEQVFRFLARRVAAERIMFVAASREPLRTAPGIATMEVGGLPENDCLRILEARGLALAPAVFDTLMEMSRGNPLILLETASRLTLAQRCGESALPISPDLGGQAEQGWAGRLRALPASTQQALAVVAAAGDVTLDVLERALKHAGLCLRDLIPAEEARLVLAGNRGYEFVHPILRGVALNGVPVSVRRDAYRGLAEESTGGRRAWYLAAGVVTPDETIARELAEAATEARQRGSYLAAAQAWHRSAELTPHPDLSTTRVLQGATDAFRGGACDDAARWCEAAQQTSEDPRRRADLALLRGRALTWLGRVGQAHRLLTAAADEVAATDTGRAHLLLSEAALPAAMHLDLAGAIRAARRCQEFPPSDAAAAVNGPLFLSLTLALTNDIPEAKSEMRRALAMLADADPLETVMELGLLGQVCNFLEFYDDAARLLHTVLDGARRTTNPAAFAYASGARAELSWWLGQWPAAYADALESAAKARALRQPGTAAFALLALARIDAARGDRAACARHAAEAVEAADFTEIRSMPIMRDAALGLDCLSQGACEEAVAHLDQAFLAFTRLGLGNPNLSPFAADLVEAHVRAGNPLAAKEVLAWLEDAGKRTGLMWPSAAGARCRAVLAEDPEEAAAGFEAALIEHEQHPAVFERARTLLCQGEALRRARRKSRARAPLLAAHRIFTMLGAAPWTQRCLTELAATGHQVPGEAPRAEGLERLSPQELQVARMVADGLNNVEVGAALFISTKTVEIHLTHIYRKLGLRSRTGLARLVTAAGL
ncbi:helix-turn-helix transcriptional regulator [Cryptosporangium aurantiacum]|uniref:Regulatory protein, luxR family n=1 Tax=Cryptosporangium aurantiacum TaxID=134849 RepID=A0A1M7R2H9_9ACTN|nr:LuxR family transcriptional regulator [Cryptosporangium aurantiacum]SHN38942.1 regulatory protein, luxR family [Cryptosporangium aurantiacum]